jgi:hypothetical protein
MRNGVDNAIQIELFDTRFEGIYPRFRHVVGIREFSDWFQDDGQSVNLPERGHGAVRLTQKAPVSLKGRGNPPRHSKEVAEVQSACAQE